MFTGYNNFYKTPNEKIIVKNIHEQYDDYGEIIKTNETKTFDAIIYPKNADYFDSDEKYDSVKNTYTILVTPQNILDVNDIVTVRGENFVVTEKMFDWSYGSSGNRVFKNNIKLVEYTIERKMGE